MVLDANTAIQEPKLYCLIQENKGKNGVFLNKMFCIIVKIVI